MGSTYYLLDTFTKEKFKGNPTPICLLEEVLSIKTMHAFAKEFSHQHFVVHTKGLRIVFLQSENEFDVELYIDSESGNFTRLKDPNDVKIVVKCFENESFH